MGTAYSQDFSGNIFLCDEALLRRYNGISKSFK